MKEMIRWTVSGLVFSALALAFLFLDVEFGRVINSNGDGKLYNGESYYNYISYKCVDNVSENDIIMTISINDINGDCTYRFDYTVLQDV